MQTMVKNLMKNNPEMISPDSSLREAAKQMQSVGCGVLPVGTADNPEGVITDRDIVIRALAQGKNPDTEKVRDYMTQEVCACNENDTIENAAEIMRENQVSRLLVKDGNGRTTGILTFGRIMRENDSREEIADVVECAIGRKAA